MMDRSNLILIAEDSDDNRIALKLMLGISGYETIEATDGRQALDRAFRDNPGLVLMDISLPLIDGIEATRQLRAQDQFQDLPIIIISAHDNDEIRHEAINAGASGYVCKPIDFDKLKALIDRHLASN